MSFEIKRVGTEMLPLYAGISESFRVESVLRVTPVDRGLGGLALEGHEVKPYVKWAEQPDRETGPTSWPEKYEVEKWGIFVAFSGGEPLGGIAIGADAPGGLRSAFEEGDVAVVWDVRVHPEARRRGIATELFTRGADWARERGFRRLKLEVTSANLPMCRLCVKVGCELAAIHRYGYETVPEASDEAMLIWFYEL
jgi:GNAT superfamily N-acetyltransferase